MRVQISKQSARFLFAADGSEPPDSLGSGSQVGSREKLRQATESASRSARELTEKTRQLWDEISSALWEADANTSPGPAEGPVASQSGGAESSDPELVTLFCKATDEYIEMTYYSALLNELSAAVLLYAKIMSIDHRVYHV